MKITLLIQRPVRLNHFHYIHHFCFHRAKKFTLHTSSLTAFFDSLGNKCYLLHNVGTLSDCGEGESSDSITTPVNLEHLELERLDAEGSCLTEEPKVLDLSTKKEKLSPQRIKVKRHGDFSVKLYF